MCGHLADWAMEQGHRVQHGQSMAYGFDRLTFFATEGDAGGPFRGWHPPLIQKLLPPEVFPGVGVLEVRAVADGAHGCAAGVFDYRRRQFFSVFVSGEVSHVEMPVVSGQAFEVIGEDRQVVDVHDAARSIDKQARPGGVDTDHAPQAHGPEILDGAEQADADPVRYRRSARGPERQDGVSTDIEA